MNHLQRLTRWIRATGGLPVVWVVLSVVVLIPVWNQRLLPMLDTPNHLGLVRAWHSYHDPSYHIADYYTLRIRPVPYIFFYWSIHMLMYVFSIEVANKIFLSAYLILFPLSILSLARALKRSPWLALGGFPLAFNQNWIYGFSSYLMSTCFLFFALAALIRWLDDGRRSSLVLLGACSVMAYFSHVMAWFCFGLCAIALLLLYRRSWRRGLYASLAMLPSVGFAVLAYFEERNARSYFKRGDGLGALGGTWRDFPTLVVEFPRRVMDLFPGNLDRVVLIVLSLTVLALCIGRGTKAASESLVQQKRLPLLLLVLGLTYLLLPYEITKPMSWWYVAPRVPSLMAPLILLLPVGAIAGHQRVVLLPLIIAAVVLPLKLTSLYRDFSRRNAGFMRMVAEVPRGSKTLVVVRGVKPSPEQSGDPSSSAPVYWHFSSWPMVLNGGYGPHLFDQGVPVVPRQRLAAPNWGTADWFNIRQAPEFDYYLVRDPAEEMWREPAIRELDRVGEWVLFRRQFAATDEP
jgi:hypothetical protein